MKALLEEHNIDPKKIPRHIAIIMDGNGRWAKKRNRPRIFGHKHGAETFFKILRACSDIGIKYLSVYTFSTENWRRPEKEVSFLLKLFKNKIKEKEQEMIDSKVKIKFLGDLSAFQKDLQNLMFAIEERGRDHTGIQLNVLLNYGGRNEIVNAVQNILKDGVIDPTLIDEDMLSNQLYTKGMPDPDIMIRTGGDVRISNFLLWQCAYSEFFFLETLWPDFSAEELIEVIRAFQTRERRYGGLVSVQ